MIYRGQWSLYTWSPINIIPFSWRCQLAIFKLERWMWCHILRHATCKLLTVWSSECSLYEIDKGHALIQNLSDPPWRLKLQPKYAAYCSNTNRHMHDSLCLFLAVDVKCGEFVPPSPTPYPWLISLIQPQNLYSPSSKRKGHLGLSFSSSGLSFFADKCSPIHPDRCHIASLPFWYIASDPATCNKEPAPGTPLPRQHSDMGDYFKGASLVALSAETLAGCHIRMHSLPCPLQECGYRLVSGSEKRQQHDTLCSHHRSPWHQAIPLAGFSWHLHSRTSNSTCPPL